LPGAPLGAQSFRHGGVEFNAARSVEIPAGKPYTVVVTEFLHHGEITPPGHNLLVAARNNELVPLRLLQLGPGDFCRLAFQTLRGQSQYEIVYGGPSPTQPLPAWTNRDGLLLETRHYQGSRLDSLDEVRTAFAGAEPFGADYVAQVHHGYNPFGPLAEPFLSHYSGILNVPAAGSYGLITSSQDCSFLLVDDKLVVAAPGRHGPRYNAHPDSRGDARLAAGPHKFDYYHAAAGDSGVMFAAWEVNPEGPKPQHPAAIASEVFHNYAIGHLPAGPATLRTARLVPDFLVKVVDELPLPDDPAPLVAVLLRDNSPRALSLEGKMRWDFGDGQASELRQADHVYLHPGLYTVKLTMQHNGRSVEMVNRVSIERPPLTQADKQHTLDEYLRVIKDYDPRTLDAVALRQWVLAYEAKADAIQSQADTSRTSREADEKRMSQRRRAAVEAELSAGQSAPEAAKFLAVAVAAVRTALGSDQFVANGDDDLMALARLAGPMARDRLGDAAAAVRIWRGAGQRLKNPELRAECETEMADIAINDMVDTAHARQLLESAGRGLKQAVHGPAAARLRRIWADFYAATGDGAAARRAYGEAEQLLGRAGPYAETTARRGAHGRSTEEFLKIGQLARAVAELRAWQQESPADKLNGYWSLLYARYWTERKQYAQAIAQAEQLQTINPDSPYVDQLLVLAAECEAARGRRDRALATLHALLKDYPGSPLVSQARQTIARLEGSKK
jgi:tetratricopeptide (TPR) repeat protein